MNIKINSVHFDSDKKLLEFIKDRINKLTVFYDNIISSEVFLRLEKSESKENKLVEIKLEIAGKVVFAKKHSKSFEESTDLCIEALRRQLKKEKEKRS